MGIEIIRGDEQAPLAGLAGRTVAVIGYGNQGRAHALNLRDTAARADAPSFTLLVGAREARLGDHRAVTDGLAALPLAEAVSAADLIIIALPDELHAEVYERSIAPHLRPGSVIGFLHGFSVHFGMVKPAPQVGVVMVAPKGPGAAVRDRYERGQGLPCLLAVHQETPARDAEALALGWANGIGSARAAIIRTTFAQEAETDLFGEQAVLCGGIYALIRGAIDTLVDQGYPRELAYLECCHELKQIADLIYERGLAQMSDAISTTAEFGMHHAADAMDDEHLRAIFSSLLADIRDGSFARKMQHDAAAGSPWIQNQRRRLRQSPDEPAGRIIRSLMPWLSNPHDGGGNGGRES